MPTTSEASEQVEVLEMGEAFEEIDGQFRFTGTHFVYRAGDSLYHAVSEARRCPSSADFKAEHLTNILLIPNPAFSPPFSPNITRAPDVPSSCYIKRPRLLSYDGTRHGSSPNHIAESLLREAEICEMLKASPHPNIAAYLGCQVFDGRITGLCFTEYHHTLMQEVNPWSHMKRKLRTVRQKKEDYGHILEGVERGIRHLHSLGFIHNDINPSNIMVHNGEGVIIDFDSCRRQGESLEGVGRTYEWFDEKVQVSIPENDLRALDEIRAWLGDESKTFQFPE